MIFVLLIVVSLFLYSLHNRVRKIEESLQLRPLSQPLVPPSVSSNAFPQTPAHTPPLQSQPLSTYISPEQPAFATTPTAPSTDGGVMEWFREDWLLKLGAFILLLGFGWFVSYAFLHNWIGPLGRVTLGMLAGIGILGFGWVRMHKYVRQGSIFLGLGAMVVLISAYSSAFVYDLFPARGALVIMFLTSAFIALASVRFKILSLAVLGIIIASVAPTTLLVNASPTHVELFAYLFAVILGTVWIVSLTGWRSLTGVGLLMFFFYSIPQIGTSTPESGTLLLFAYAFAFLFFMTNTLGILKIRDGDIKPDAIIAAGNGLLLLTWIITTANPDWASLIIAGWMILFTIAAFAIFAITKRREPFFVYAGVGIAMLAAATAAELDGAALTIAYTIESAVVPFVAYLIMQDRAIAERLSLLTIGPALLSLSSIFARWYPGISWDHFFVLFLMMSTLLLLGVFFMFLPKREGRGEFEESFLIAGSVYAYVLLWLSVHASLPTDQDFATMICLVIYTLIGLSTYAYGKLSERRNLSYYGGTLLGFTIAYLLLVSVWDMELPGRIVTFFLIGTLLMMTAFIGRKK